MAGRVRVTAARSACRACVHGLFLAQASMRRVVEMPTRQLAKGALADARPCSGADAIRRVWFITVAAALFSGMAKHMHFGDDEDHMVTYRTCVPEVRRSTRRFQHPTAGWRDGVPAGIPEAFGGHPLQT